MTALVHPRLWVPRLEPWRILRPLKNGMQDLSRGVVGAPIGHSMQSGHFTGGEPAAGGGADITYTDDGDYTSTVDGTTIDVGPVTTTDSECVAVVMGYTAGGDTLSITGLTIDPGGDNIAMTSLYAQTADLGSVSSAHTYFYYNGTISSKTLRITFNISSQKGAVTIISLENLESSTPEDTDFDVQVSTTVPSLDALDAVSAGGIALVGRSNHGDNYSFTWSGFTGTEIAALNMGDTASSYGVWVGEDYDGSTLTCDEATLDFRSLMTGICLR